MKSEVKKNENRSVTNCICYDVWISVLFCVLLSHLSKCYTKDWTEWKNQEEWWHGYTKWSKNTLFFSFWRGVKLGCDLPCSWLARLSYLFDLIIYVPFLFSLLCFAIFCYECFYSMRKKQDLFATRKGFTSFNVSVHFSVWLIKVKLCWVNIFHISNLDSRSSVSFFARIESASNSSSINKMDIFPVVDFNKVFPGCRDSMWMKWIGDL